MSSNQDRLMTKSEIAERLGVSAADVQMWAQAFPEWLDVDATWKDKKHDEDDFRVFTLIKELGRLTKQDAPSSELMNRIERINKELGSIRQRRHRDPEFKRRQVVYSAIGIVSCDYEWLRPLQPCVDSIADFGCWDTASEAIALRLILKATRVVVIDKSSKHIDNARDWLKTTRAGNPGFENYIKDREPEFVVGDMTEDELQNKLQECDFDLSYCQNVLCSMEDNSERLQKAINAMARVVKPGGRVIAYERKIHRDISQHFRDAGLVKDSSLRNAPKWSYCYKKLYD